MKCHSVFPGITSSKTDNQMLKRLNTINSRAEFTLHSCPTLWQQSGLYLCHWILASLLCKCVLEHGSSLQPEEQLLAAKGTEVFISMDSRI
jgi:hypothetical protein